MHHLLHTLIAVAALIGAVIIWHAIMPTSAGWLTINQLLGSFFIFIFTTGASVGLHLTIEKKH